VSAKRSALIFRNGCRESDLGSFAQRMKGRFSFFRDSLACTIDGIVGRSIEIAEHHKPLFWRRLATKLSFLIVLQLRPTSSFPRGGDITVRQDVLLA
jgi:hypothetical protein